MNDLMFNELKKDLINSLNTEYDECEQDIFEHLDVLIKRYKEKYIFSIKERCLLEKKLINDIKKLDIIEELLEDDSISEIMINGYENIFYEKEGRLLRWNKSFESKEKLLDVVQRIAAKSNKIVNESHPISDTRLSDGTRVNIVLNPIAIDGPVVTMRKFFSNPITIDTLISMNSISCEAADFLKEMVIMRKNIFVCGGTGSGKTSMLNVLSDFIPKDERIITIEDSAELKLKDVKNLVRLEARKANIEGKNEVTIRDLIKSSLRMRPDRIIVGEVRGAETIDMLQAMNTGHLGFPSCLHCLHRRNRCYCLRLLQLPAPI